MKNNLLSTLRTAFQIAAQSDMPPRQIIEQIEARQESAQQSRRQFLKTGTRAGILLGLGGASTLQNCAHPAYAKNVRIAIVGAGMAGLSAAYHLRRKGIVASIFEGDKRAGGRIKSARLFDSGRLNTEIGAEFIDTIHQDMLYMARVAGMHENLMDVEKDPLPIRDAFFIENQHHSLEALIAEFQAFYPRLQADQKKMDGAMMEVFDKISMADYIEDMPVSNWVKKMLHAAYLGENGLETSEQSAANLLSVFEIKNKHFYPFGSSDERFKVIGGNEQIPKKIAEMLHSQLRFEHKLKAVKENSNNSLSLIFSENGTNREETFDLVIMTVPFSVLRETDLQMELPATKKRVIQELGYGTNSKFIVETTSRPWRKAGYRGYLLNERIPNGWDSAQMQNNNEGAGTFTCYFGGNRGKMAIRGTEEEQLKYILPELDGAFPGVSTALSGKTELANWSANPFIKGSYSCFKPGQAHSFEGLAFEAVRNLHFAGEHCSTEYWGFMNGAAETGRRAAENVLKKIRI